MKKLLLSILLCASLTGWAQTHYFYGNSTYSRDILATTDGIIPIAVILLMQ